MREAGDYPYTRALDDPSFMAESHFNPWRMPIAAHWRMAERNAVLLASGKGPHLTPRATSVDADALPPVDAPARGISSVEGERLAVPDSQVSGLTRALDFWWAYAIAAGLPRWPVLGAALFLLLAALYAFARAWSGMKRLEVQPLQQAPDSWMA
jgi:hypothetical protein